MVEQAVQKFGRDTRLRFFEWVAKHGPFLEDVRISEKDDCFYFDNLDVTDYGLGEAARRVVHKEETSVYSFADGSDYNFRKTPLTITHGLPEEPLALVPVGNYWSVDALISVADAAVSAPVTWEELMHKCKVRFPSLIIGAHCLEVLTCYPFLPSVARRIFELLGVLQSLMDCLDHQGNLSPEGEQLRQKHFVGEKAWFTDESASNKREFASEMTFPDPVDGEKKITCYWHGKIKTPQYRVHFEWPVKKGQTLLKIAYIGPKISKL